MDGKEKTIVYALIAACVLGIIIIGALAVYSKNNSVSDGFSEVYFENNENLPHVVETGNKIGFAFTIVSHEKDSTAYKYRAIYDDQTINSGLFYLDPAGPNSKRANKDTISLSFVPNSSSLVRSSEPTVTESKMRYNAALGTMLSQGSEFGHANMLTSPEGYSLISWGKNGTAKQIDMSTSGKFILPIALQISNIPSGIGLLIFDPKLKESYDSSSRTIVPVGIENNITSSNNGSLSNIGYIISRDEWNVTNDRGSIEIQHRTLDAHYRYAFKKVSVEVFSLGSVTGGINDTTGSTINEGSAEPQYEIHFWVLVKENTEKVQNL